MKSRKFVNKFMLVCMCFSMLLLTTTAIAAEQTERAARTDTAAFSFSLPGGGNYAYSGTQEKLTTKTKAWVNFETFSNKSTVAPCIRLCMGSGSVFATGAYDVYSTGVITPSYYSGYNQTEKLYNVFMKSSIFAESSITRFK